MVKHTPGLNLSRFSSLQQAAWALEISKGKLICRFLSKALFHDGLAENYGAIHQARLGMDWLHTALTLPSDDPKVRITVKEYRDRTDDWYLLRRL